MKVFFYICLHLKTRYLKTDNVIANQDIENPLVVDKGIKCPKVKCCLAWEARVSIESNLFYSLNTERALTSEKAKLPGTASNKYRMLGSKAVYVCF